MPYINRIVDAELERALGAFGAVLLEGPKWCGKTTTAARVARSSLMLSDPAGDFASRKLAQVEPSVAIEGESPRLIDEWQEVPKLWDAVRYRCDATGGRGLFVLTGSATPDDAHAPMHSGVGRIARVRMGTLTLQEQGISSGKVSVAGLLQGKSYTALGSLDVQTIAQLVVRGGWPSTAGVPAPAASMLARGYVDGVCNSDVSRIDGVRRDPDKVTRLVRSLARNESTLATMKSVLADLGGDITRQTAAKYVSILSRLHFVQDVPAWNPALRSPVVLRQAAKHHLADPSLAAAALGASTESLLEDVKTLGLLFESLVIHDLMAYAQASGARVYHYHDSSDLEVDAIVQADDGRWLAVEVKLGAGGVQDGCQNLLRLESKMTDAGSRPPAAKVVVVGFGEPAHLTEDNVQVVPIDTLGV